jgi:serine/threonine protein kinase
VRRCAQCQVDYPDALEFCPRDGAKLPPLTGDTKALYDPLIGSTIDGRYVIESVLGEGGMGVVYAARHAIIDKRVAIKVLRKEAAADEASAHRFLAEAKAASKIGQQNIVDITDFGVLADGHAYFVMEFIDGVTLAKIMHTTGPLPPARAAWIAVQVCKGLHAAHTKGIIHRDLKPENIFVLDREGVTDYVKIVDFGIARDASSTKRLTVAGMVMGTPEYMAPEQASGQETDHRVDQYALGCILYEMLTNSTPFKGENPMQTLTKHVFDAVTLPSKLRNDLTIPKELEAVVMRTLAKKREERYADLDALMQALIGLEDRLRGILVPEAVAQKAKTLAATAKPPGDSIISGELSVPRRRPTLFMAVAVAAMAVLVLTIIALKSGSSTTTTTTAPPTTPTAPTTTAARPAAPDPPDPKPVPPEPKPDPSGNPTVEITINSQPPGAEVTLKDEVVCRSTPCKVTQPKHDGDLEFVLRKTGFKDTSRMVRASKDTYMEALLPREPTSTKVAVKHVVVAPVRPVTKASTNPDTKTPDAAKKTPHASELRNPFDDPSPK